MKDLKEKSIALKQQFLDKLEKIQTEEQLEDLRIKFLSRKGPIADLVSNIKKLSLENKKILGPIFNILKTSTEEAFNKKKKELYNKKIDQLNQKKKYFDVTAYKPGVTRGSLHIYTQMIEEIEDIFISMGYRIADGPEVETDYYNFGALNIPEDHPARDMYDTFWLDIPGLLLRTHTSPTQIHAMESQKPPIAIAAPGRCYRHEATDASHDFLFMQVEGLFIDKNVSLANLFATVKIFLQKVFNKKDLNIRVRPGYFPFVEPGVEIDMTCPFCKNGCSVCKKTTWIELCPGGLVHPNVLRAGNIDPEIYSGFAFGLGLERLAMLKYSINDIRLFHNNKIDFLDQF